MPSATTSLTAVFHGVGQPLELTRIPLPDLYAGEALVRIECCTMCGSDLHTITGARSEKIPSILGHEIVGVVAELANPPLNDVAGRPLQAGDRVTWSVCVSCGQCPRCLGGLPQKCPQVAKYGHEIAKGRYSLSGGLAEFILLRAGSSVVKVDPEIADEVICPVNCATATVAAAFRSAGPVAGKRVLILGAGLLGLTAAAMARAGGAHWIAVSDLDQGRLDLSLRFGADTTAPGNLDPDALRAKLSESGEASAFDIVLELSGSPAAVEVACVMADVGARIVLVGSVMHSRQIQLDPQRIVRNWLCIQGVHNYAPEDLQTATKFLQTYQHEFPFADLITKTYPLSKVNEAIEAALQDKPIRVAIRP